MTYEGSTPAASTNPFAAQYTNKTGSFAIWARLRSFLSHGHLWPKLYRAGFRVWSQRLIPGASFAVSSVPSRASDLCDGRRTVMVVSGAGLKGIELHSEAEVIAFCAWLTLHLAGKAA